MNFNFSLNALLPEVVVDLVLVAFKKLAVQLANDFLLLLGWNAFWGHRWQLGMKVCFCSGEVLLDDIIVELECTVSHYSI